jgi:hypothetical protein
MAVSTRTGAAGEPGPDGATRFVIAGWQKTDAATSEPGRECLSVGSVVPPDLDVIGEKAQEPAAAANPALALPPPVVLDGDIVDGLTH